MGMAWTWILISAFGASMPRVEIDAAVGDPARVEHELTTAWAELAALYRKHGGQDPAGGRRFLRVVVAEDFSAAQAGESHPGRIRLLPLARSRDAEQWRLALRHEIAHQFLWQVCPAGAGDALFHEALALWTSGELSRWAAGAYLSLPEARKRLSGNPRLDRPAARRALARVLANLTSRDGELPAALAWPLRRCADGARWQPLTVSALVDAAFGKLAEVTVVLDRHSGALVEQRGPVNLAMPYGSLLKPFALAGQSEAPQLPVDPARAEWLCGEELPDPLDGATALLRSCNGYFLDWASQRPEVAQLGSYGALLQGLGLARPPADMRETIGIRPTLRLSPLALAQAYRLLAAARPDLIALLQRNPVEGTLSGLAASPRLEGVAVKTGTVRDAQSTPRIGWLAAVDRDLVVVMARPGRAPRRFAGELVKTLEALRTRQQHRAVAVQVLGLVPAEHVEARCEGLGVTASRYGPIVHPRRLLPLLALTAAGRALCLGAPWQLRFPDLGPTQRAYAGTFAFSPPPRYRAPPGQQVPRRARLARQGSSFVFTGSRGGYVAGVLRSEDAAAGGEARIALAQVIAHNVEQPRHPGRAICDTTHCQVFQGTAPVDPLLERALGSPPLPWSGWLPFSRGGDESWEQARSRAEVAELLGRGFASLRFDGLRLRYLRSIDDGEAIYDEATELPCELLRNRLKLPACPQRAVERGEQVVFSGRGEGHGLGLQVEQAKASQESARRILQAAYGAKR